MAHFFVCWTAGAVACRSTSSVSFDVLIALDIFLK